MLIWLTSRLYSASLPVHQWMFSGWVSRATESTQSCKAASRVVIKLSPETMMSGGSPAVVISPPRCAESQLEPRPGISGGSSAARGPAGSFEDVLLGDAGPVLPGARRGAIIPALPGGASEPDSGPHQLAAAGAGGTRAAGAVGGARVCACTGEDR